jgi:pimeloyl-ACP methyl ester carboxylesterase
MASGPTIVLVHGAFADASTWWPVTLRLLDAGYAVLAPPVGNQSLLDDAAYIRAYVSQIDGPVLLVGNGYGGAVITVAGAADNVIGLLYVAGYALEEGETVVQLHDSFPSPDVNPYLECGVFPDQSGRGTREISVRIGSFREYVADGLPEDEMQVLAVSQRPVAEAALREAATGAAWRDKPTWGIVTGADRTISPQLQLYTYTRAGAGNIVELDAPHLVMQTHPAEVARVITDALAEFTA